MCSVERRVCETKRLKKLSNAVRDPSLVPTGLKGKSYKNTFLE